MLCVPMPYPTFPPAEPYVPLGLATITLGSNLPDKDIIGVGIFFLYSELVYFYVQNFGLKDLIMVNYFLMGTSHSLARDRLQYSFQLKQSSLVNPRDQKTKTTERPMVNGVVESDPNVVDDRMQSSNDDGVLQVAFTESFSEFHSESDCLCSLTSFHNYMQKTRT